MVKIRHSRLVQIDDPGKDRFSLRHFPLRFGVNRWLYVNEP
jgi:hypothetical protein